MSSLETAVESTSDGLPCGQGGARPSYLDIPAHNGRLLPEQTHSKGTMCNESISVALFPILPLQRLRGTHAGTVRQ